MNFEILIPLTLFICIAYAIRAVVDARVRGKIVSRQRFGGSACARCCRARNTSAATPRCAGA